MKVHTIRGGGGVKLHVREWGRPTGTPILLIHGWSQNHLCWMKQYESELQNEFRIVALDLRGHGMSDAPPQTEQYTDGEKWADDIAAIMDQLALDRPILVGWSYGGFIISDYVRKYDQGKIAGINFVAATVVLGAKAFGSLVGPGFLENAPGACDVDVPTNIAAIRKFLRTCIVKPIEQHDFEVALAFNMIVHPQVRAFLLQRELDFAAVLKGLTVPVLVAHGRSDIVVLPAMSDYILQQCKTAEPSWYDGIGHAPFLEEPQRFNRELARFADRVHGRHADFPHPALGQDFTPSPTTRRAHFGLVRLTALGRDASWVHNQCRSWTTCVPTPAILMCLQKLRDRPLSEGSERIRLVGPLRCEESGEMCYSPKCRNLEECLWHFSDVTAGLRNVCCWGKSGSRDCVTHIRV